MAASTIAARGGEWGWNKVSPSALPVHMDAVGAKEAGHAAALTPSTTTAASAASTSISLLAPLWERIAASTGVAVRSAGGVTDACKDTAPSGPRDAVGLLCTDDRRAAGPHKAHATGTRGPRRRLPRLAPTPRTLARVAAEGAVCHGVPCRASLRGLAAAPCSPQPPAAMVAVEAAVVLVVATVVAAMMVAAQAALVVVMAAQEALVGAAVAAAVPPTVAVAVAIAVALAVAVAIAVAVAAAAGVAGTDARGAGTAGGSASSPGALVRSGTTPNAASLATAGDAACTMTVSPAGVLRQLAPPVATIAAKSRLLRGLAAPAGAVVTVGAGPCVCWAAAVTCTAGDSTTRRRLMAGPVGAPVAAAASAPSRESPCGCAVVAWAAAAVVSPFSCAAGGPGAPRAAGSTTEAPVARARLPRQRSGRFSANTVPSAQGLRCSELTRARTTGGVKPAATFASTSGFAAAWEAAASAERGGVAAAGATDQVAGLVDCGAAPARWVTAAMPRGGPRCEPPSGRDTREQRRSGAPGVATAWS